MGVAVVGDNEALCGGQAVIIMEEGSTKTIPSSLSRVSSRVPSFESGCIRVTKFGVCWHNHNEKVSFL